MERMFAVAVRDRDDLFLWLRLRRAAGTDIYYVVPTGREQDPKWEKWSRDSLAAAGFPDPRSDSSKDTVGARR